MKRFYEDKVVPVGQPSQKRWVPVCILPLWPGWLGAGELGRVLRCGSYP